MNILHFIDVKNAEGKLEKLNKCHYCDKEAKYMGTVDKINKTYTLVDVCQDHFIYNEAS